MSPKEFRALRISVMDQGEAICRSLPTYHPDKAWSVAPCKVTDLNWRKYLDVKISDAVEAREKKDWTAIKEKLKVLVDHLTAGQEKYDVIRNVTTTIARTSSESNVPEGHIRVWFVAVIRPKE